jgi:hypothetical protein
MTIALNLTSPLRDIPRDVADLRGRRSDMKIALLALILGALGGAALGIGLGLAWTFPQK